MAARAAHAPLGILNTGATAQQVFRFNRMLQNEMADFLALLARTAREATRGRKLVILFYGYTFEVATMATAPANTGHLLVQATGDGPVRIALPDGTTRTLDMRKGQCANIDLGQVN